MDDQKPTNDTFSAGTDETHDLKGRDILRRNTMESLPHLLKAVGDSNYRVREDALKGICSFPHDVIFPRLEDLLRDHENANLRTAAMEAFPRCGKDAVPYLLRLLKDRDDEVRMFSATILGEVQDPAAVDALIEVLKDPDENLRHACAESLGKIGDARAVDTLIECLDQDFWIQYPAIIALGNIGDLSATEHLIKLLDDEMLREAVIEALGKIGDTSVIPVLAETLSSNDPSIRNNTIASLVNIQRMVKSDETCLPSIRKALDNDELIVHLFNSLRNPDSEVKKNAIIALGWLKEARAVENLLELIHDYDLEEYVVESLVSIGEHAIPEIIEKLHNPDPKIRISLIRCIDWIGNINGITACIPFLSDENIEVKYQAVMAMSGGLDLEEIEDALLGLLSDPAPEIQDILVEIFGRSRSKHLANKLLPELSSEVRMRKILAIQILGRQKNPHACEPLQSLLDDQSDEIRAHAYMALSHIQADQLSGEILNQGIRDKNPLVRKAVAHCMMEMSLENHKDALLILLKEPDLDVRLAAIEALGKIGDVSCLDHLITGFSDCNKRLRLAILRTMGNIHDIRSTRFLIGLLKEPDPDLKQMALESLGKIKDKRSTPDLIMALGDPNWRVRSAAIQALTKTGDRRCTPHLLKRLEDPEDIIRKETILALGHLGSKDAVNSILPFIQNEKFQNEVFNSLEKLGVPDPDFFYSYFKRSNTRLKCRLIELFARLKDPRMVDFLIRILDEEFFTVRCWVAKALGGLGNPNAISPLLRIQREDPSDEVRKEAALALKRLEAKK
ncbi:MAG: HEAT repeat domain-containing protein [bacterium]